MINTTTATAAELIAFFNANTGGNPVKKFADRKTAERRVAALIEEMIEDGDAEGYELTSAEQAQLARESAADDREIAAWNAGSATPEAPEHSDDDSGSVSCFETHGLTRCPSCGIHLCNGISQDGDDSNGKALRHETGYEFECMGCGSGFGAKVTRYVTVRNGVPVTPRPAMVASMKIDRQIVSVNSGIVYKNACQVWKAGLVSASQGDRLSAVLYGAAKQGNRLMSITLNGYVFALAVK